MKFHIVIPARLESCRLPQKLLLASSGTPLINHTALQALKIIKSAPELFSGVTIAADDQMIINAVNSIENKSEGLIKAVMTSIDHKSGSDRIAEAVKVGNIKDEAVINIQGDEPDIPVDAVVNFAKFITELDNFQMATLAYPINGASNIQNPNLVKVVTDNNKNALYFSRSPIPYNRELPNGTPETALGHIGIYAYKVSVINNFVSLPQSQLEKSEKLEQLRALENGIPIAVQILDKSLPKGIDTADDYEEFLRRVQE